MMLYSLLWNAKQSPSSGEYSEPASDALCDTCDPRLLESDAIKFSLMMCTGRGGTYCASASALSVSALFPDLTLSKRIDNTTELFMSW
jgi:hypothetical protein